MKTYSKNYLWMASHLLICSVAIFVLNIIFTPTLATMYTFQAMKRSNMDNKSMNERLLWKFNSRGLAPCGGYCNRDQKCVGIFYNKVTFNCQGHSINFGDVSEATDDLHSRYYIALNGDGYIGDSCADASDCVTINSECRLNKCMCVPGYSFAPKARACLGSCSVYGPEFLEVRDHYISKTNNEIMDNVSLDECFEFCRNRTAYTCKSLEYGRSSLQCFLQNATKMEWSSRWYPDLDLSFNISYYQRDCD